MRKVKLFIDNFLIYGLGGVISKIIPLVMVPIITRLMPDPTYYGLYDLSNTITSFGSAIAVMGMYDSMYRYFFEKDDDEYKRDICSTALLFTLGTSILVFLIMLVFEDFIAEFIFSSKDYGVLVYLTAMATLIGATNSIISAPTRMQNQRKIFLIVNLLSPVIGYSISVPLLIQGYYIIALPLAAVISSFIMEMLFARLNRSWFCFRRFRLDLLKDLLKLAIPLAPTFLVYWVFNSCDRLMIAKLMGVDATGIYSVGSKLGQASQLIYTAFAGGWQYFAFSTMKEADQVRSNSIVMEYLGIISFISTMFICAGCHWIYSLLFVGVYVEGYIVSPYLFLSPLLLMLYQVVVNQLLIIKKTWPGTVILSIGAIINLLMNMLLIPIFGIEGAGMATLAGYAGSLFLMNIILIKMKLLIVSKKFIIAILIMSAFFFGWRIFFKDNVQSGLIYSLFSASLIVGMYRSDIMYFVRRKQV